MQAYLSSTFFVDSDHPSILDFAVQNTRSDASPLENAVSLYYAVREGWRYNPYRISREKHGYRASSVMAREFAEGGHCIDKAMVLAASARAAGIPSRLHFANVRNHIGTEKLEKALGSSTLVFHGYTELWLEGKWVAATPAFNKGLCDKLGVSPMEFDGVHDSVFQEFDKEGGKFMEYLHDYGTFEDLPFDLMVSEWKKYYPGFVKKLAQKNEMQGS